MDAGGQQHWWFPLPEMKVAGGLCSFQRVWGNSFSHLCRLLEPMPAYLNLMVTSSIFKANSAVSLMFSLILPPFYKILPVFTLLPPR